MLCVRCRDEPDAVLSRFGPISAVRLLVVPALASVPSVLALTVVVLAALTVVVLVTLVLAPRLGSATAHHLVLAALALLVLVLTLTH
jgi:hypothetical protein